MAFPAENLANPIQTILLQLMLLATPELLQEQLESGKTADGGFVYARHYH